MLDYGVVVNVDVVLVKRVGWTFVDLSFVFVFAEPRRQVVSERGERLR